MNDFHCMIIDIMGMNLIKYGYNKPQYKRSTRFLMAQHKILYCIPYSTNQDVERNELLKLKMVGC